MIKTRESNNDKVIIDSTSYFKYISLSKYTITLKVLLSPTFITNLHLHISQLLSTISIIIIIIRNKL